MESLPENTWIHSSKFYYVFAHIKERTFINTNSLKRHIPLEIRRKYGVGESKKGLDGMREEDA